MTRLVAGFGVNDASYKVNVGKVRCKYYTRWKAMIQRCYSDSHILNRPTYDDVVVCDAWRSFTAFREWVVSWERCFGSADGLELDKDIIGDSLEYSPEKCTFVPKMVNSFVLGDGGKGYTTHNGRYRAVCKNPFTRKPTTGTFVSTVAEAEKERAALKTAFAIQLAPLIADPKVAYSLITRYV